MTDVNSEMVSAMTSWLESMGIEVPQTIEPVSDDEPSGPAGFDLMAATGLPQNLPQKQAMVYFDCYLDDDGGVVVKNNSNLGKPQVKAMWSTKMGQRKVTLSGDGKTAVVVFRRDTDLDDIVRIAHSLITNLVRGRDWSSEHWDALGSALAGYNPEVTEDIVKGLYGVIDVVDVKSFNDNVHPAPVTPSKKPTKTAWKKAVKAAQAIVTALDVPKRTGKGKRTPKSKGGLRYQKPQRR